MSDYFLARVNPLINRGSYLTHNWGEIPRQATKELIFKHKENNQTRATTDLALTLKKRNKRFAQFRNTYYRLFKKGEISVLLLVCSIDNYKSPSIALKDCIRKIKRLNHRVLGYIAIRDIGDIKFKRHFHIMLSIKKISKVEFEILKGKKRSENYEFILCEDLPDFEHYLSEKAVYAPYKHKSYYSSRQFRKI